MGENKRAFNSSRWVVKMLLEHKIKPEGEGAASLTLLDVGALDENYHAERPWLKVTAIDLRSSRPFVKEVCYRTALWLWEGEASERLCQILFSPHFSSNSW